MKSFVEMFTLREGSNMENPDLIKWGKKQGMKEKH